MKPFFTYYGGKWRAAPRYPKPVHRLIVEPFAGSAGYATRHHENEVLLLDKDERIVETWAWLIAATPADVMRLPLVEPGDDLRKMALPQGAKNLIGFWCNKGAAGPCHTPSAWMRSGACPDSYWGAAIRRRIADQVPLIKHWRVAHSGYDSAPNVEATWFIDPPYEKAGLHYRHGAADIDYARLAAWCRDRIGQTLVCENEGAHWLPFEAFMVAKATPGRRRLGVSREVLWQQTWTLQEMLS